MQFYLVKSLSVIAYFIFSTNHPLRLQANRDKKHSLDKKLKFASQ